MTGTFTHHADGTERGNHPTEAAYVLSLTEDEVRFLHDALQRDAVGLLRHPEPGATALDTLASPVYRQNRTLFGKMWDTLNAM